GFLRPVWNRSAFVYIDTSSVISSSPKAPDPVAWGLGSGTRSRSKRASFSTRATSWSSSGPSAPTLSEWASDTRGAPDSAVEGMVGSNGGTRSSPGELLTVCQIGGQGHPGRLLRAGSGASQVEPGAMPAGVPAAASLTRHSEQIPR